MIHKINGRYAPLEVFEWFLVIVKNNEQYWCVKKYEENGTEVKELIIL